MPIALASSSVCCSSAQQACGAVGARTEPEGWWFVYTQWASTCSALGLVRAGDVHRRELGEERRVGGVGAVVDDQDARGGR